jgi:hypothetical protein
VTRPPPVDHVRALLDRADSGPTLNGIAIRLGLVDRTADAATVRRRLARWCAEGGTVKP